jgi:hypothetical protein
MTVTEAGGAGSFGASGEAFVAGAGAGAGPLSGSSAAANAPADIAPHTRIAAVIFCPERMRSPENSSWLREVKNRRPVSSSFQRGDRRQRDSTIET